MNEERCIKCGSCMRACPVLNDPSGHVFAGPRTVGIDAPRFPEKVMIGNDAMMCTMCHACEWACPSSITITRSMLKLRSDLADNLDPLPGHRRMLENVAATGRTVDVQFQGWREEGNATLYFPGCIGLGRLPDLVRSTSALLNELGIGHDISSRAVCCGSPLLKIGARERAEEVRERNMELFYSYERIVTSCPGCTYHLKKEYGVNVVHITELLPGNGLRSGLKGRWALQVPCHLKRGVSPWAAEGMATALDEAGVSLVRTPGEDSCCGGGGGMLSGFPSVAGSMAGNRKLEVERAGAEGVITACPFCALNLGREGVKVLDVSEAILGKD